MQRPPSDQPIKYLNLDDGKSTSQRSVCSVPAIMNYVSPESTDIYTRRDLAGTDDALMGAIWNPTVVRISNARLGVATDPDDDSRTEKKPKALNLDANGFELYTNSHNEEVTALKQIDYCHQDEVIDTYYPLCEQLVAQAIVSQSTPKSTNPTAKTSPPIACICAFDHNVRSSDRASVGKIKSNAEDESPSTPQVQNPAGLVHADYTRDSAPRRLLDLAKPPKLNDVLRHKLLAQNRDSLLDPEIVKDALDGKRRFAFINVWRNIDLEHSVKETPLACVDAATASVDDLRVFKIHYVDRVGENYFICPANTDSVEQHKREQNAAGHKWYYYPDMTINEALLLKQWDSLGGIACGAEQDGDANLHDNSGLTSTSTFTIHSAFLDPSCPDGAPPRKSIEVRCVVIWDKEEE